MQPHWILLYTGIFNNNCGIHEVLLFCYLFCLYSLHLLFSQWLYCNLTYTYTHAHSHIWSCLFQLLGYTTSLSSCNFSQKGVHNNSYLCKNTGIILNTQTHIIYVPWTTITTTAFPCSICYYPSSCSINKSLCRFLTQPDINYCVSLLLLVVVFFSPRCVCVCFCLWGVRKTLILHT